MISISFRFGKAGQALQPALTDFDLYLFAEEVHIIAPMRSLAPIWPRETVCEGVHRFAVWAPNAELRVGDRRF